MRYPTALKRAESASPAPPDAKRDGKHEELLRLEIRHTADVMLRVVQWGITVEIAVATAMFYARREIKADLTSFGFPSSPLLPWKIHLIGTLFLAMLAGIFTVLVWLIQRRRMGYRLALYRLPDKLIDEPRPTKYGNLIYPVMFWLFPAFDLALRVYYWCITGA